ncbi:hypothetical protein RN001_009793 [Aquatica leii]|uniref:Uncharacterized protein n=1 Tax=Aquatica leii TaxID=1421715 RepID=A0AAN7P5P2_9COLE|nr:hypothetical protein RN001_009793 [Aquatica leii]
MSQLSGPEIKHSLRKLDYPLCAKEAIIKIGQLICNRVPSLKHMDLALDLMAELIFCEVDRRGNKRHSPLTSLDELQLLDILYDYLNNTSNETSRNAVFLSLFSGTTAMMRSAVLSKLVSVAVGIPSPTVLSSASVWMQQLGNTSHNSNQLAKALIKDYFVLSPNIVHKLNVLPHIAPQFTANFLTAIANMYFTDGKKEAFTFPSQNLLETITLWVNENSGLCIAAQQIQSSLPPGAIAMEATTPLAGLLRWCILAPIYNEDSDLYGKLHLGLLNSILEIPSTNPPRAISAAHLVQPVGIILRFLNDEQLKVKTTEQIVDKQKTLIENKLQLCLDRFAQAIQVALSINCVYGNMEDLFYQLQQLPQNRLLRIVIHTHKLNK